MVDSVLLSLEPYFKCLIVAHGRWQQRGQLGCATRPSPGSVLLATADLRAKTRRVPAEGSSPKRYAVVTLSHIKLKHQQAGEYTKTLPCLLSSRILYIHGIHICKIGTIIPPLPKNGKLGNDGWRC